MRASTTSSSTKLPRLREEIGRGKLRQRSSISLSLASVLVMSAKMRAFLPSTSPSDLAADLRTVPSRSERRCSTSALLSSLPSSGKRKPAIVSSKRRTHAARPATYFSCSSFSSSSPSWCGRRSEEHTSELQSPDHLVCRLLLEKKKS